MSTSTRRHVRLVDGKPLSPSVRGMTFEAMDGSPISFVAGQWVELHLPTADGVIKRSYSIASRPGAPSDGAFEIAVTRVPSGPGSSALHELAVGDTLEMTGPTGFFTREGTDLQMPAVFVGAGTGLAPLRAMTHEALVQGGSAPLVVLFGARTEEDILWSDEWRALTQEHPRLRFETTLSRGAPSWTGRRGWVQAHVADVVRAVAPAHVYVCGLSAMVRDVRNVLKQELGIDRKLVHSERYD